jgi:F-type H+-transporting ATPase subunit b
MTFDWATFAFQIVNVLILLAILQHLLFRPIAGIIAARRAETEQAVAQAETARQEAEAAAKAAQAERSALAARRAALMDEATKAADAARKAALDKAREEAATLMADARAEAETIRAEGEAAALDRARSLALTIAARLLDAAPADARVTGYPDRLAEALHAMPDEARARLLAGGVALVAPRPLTAAEAAEARRALAPWQLEDIAIEQDAALIAGLELRGPNGVLRNSLAHDLDRVARALDTDDRAAA